MSFVGLTAHRIDAFAKVKGEALYPGDIDMPEQVFMKVLFAKRAHAIIKSIRTDIAENLPGVIAVLTAKDVPVNEYGLITNDQPVLCGPGSSKPFADHVRFVGDQVAIVVAESEAIAEAARDAIQVEYQELPIVSDPLVAVHDDAPLLHPDRGSNVFVQYRIRKGDIEQGFKEADVIIEGDYKTPAQEHAYLQPEAGIAYLDDAGRITVIVAGQWTHEDQEQIAHALNVPLEKVRVIYPAIGGAFGGREDMSVQIILGLAVLRLSERGIHRPVKIIWSREESMIGHHKRHPFFIHTRWGAKQNGKLTAVEVDLLSDGGAYMYTSTKVLGNATLMCTGPYEVPNVRVDARSVYTNNIPTGAFRGFGGPQGAFAAESQMNKLAQALGLDPVEIRMRNTVREGSILSVGTPLPKGVSMDKVIAECARNAGWVESSEGWKAPELTEKLDPHKKRGIGFACAFKNVGFSFGAPEQCWATLELHGTTEIEKAILYHAGADVGQGAHTIFTQMAAEALGISMDKVQLVASDTASSLSSGSVSASRMTFMAGNSIRGAAEQALEKWQNEERPAVATYQYRPPRTTPLDPQTGKSEPNFAYGYVAEAAEVEVDLETGQAKIIHVVCADDVGKAINPGLVTGQVEGAVVQAAGYTMMEDFIQKNGQTLTRHLSTYLIPTILDIPDSVQSVVLECPDPIGPWGARGMGEMPFLPLAPAVSAAVEDATGVWFNEFPLTAERILTGIEEDRL
jgi:CO/xanthine dehydrogenase Mo-binding subunit